MMFEGFSSDLEAIVFDRQLKSSFFDSKLFEKIKNTSVLIPGCGALGSATAMLMVKMGFKRLRIVDHDFVEPSNFPRTFSIDLMDSFSYAPKVIICERKLLEINPYVEIEAFHMRISRVNISHLLDGVNLVMDGLDNIKTRQIIASSAWKRGIPYIYTGVNDRYFNVMPIVPKITPCFECIIRKPEKEILGVPVLTNTVTVAASIAVSEALKILSNVFESALIIGDVLEPSIEKVKVSKEGCECEQANQIAIEGERCYSEVDPYSNMIIINVPYRGYVTPEKRYITLRSLGCRLIQENPWLSMGLCENKCVLYLHSDGRVEFSADCPEMLEVVGEQLDCKELLQESI